MKIERHAPMVRRGVTQLMYVGDDDAVETATKPAPPNWGKIAKIAGIVWIAMWVVSGISPGQVPRR
jgi:hypothetical protein